MDKYEIQRDDVFLTYITFSDDTQTALSYEDTTAVSGTSYSYKVRAFDVALAGQTANQSDFTAAISIVAGGTWTDVAQVTSETWTTV